MCSNCHEPHSLKLRAQGNALCGQCHAADSFDTPGSPSPQSRQQRRPNASTAICRNATTWWLIRAGITAFAYLNRFLAAC